MTTGGGPEKASYLDTTPEVNEIIQPRVDPQIVEIQNIYDSDGIALGNVNLTKGLVPLDDTVVTYVSIADDTGK